MLSDDVTVLREGVPIMVEAGYPRLRLWPESVSALYGQPDALPRITPTWEKRHLDLDTAGVRFHDSPLPLGALYLLSRRRGTALMVRPLSPRRALLTLIGHAYTAHLLDAPMRARQLERLARVAERVPVREVLIPDDATGLARLCDRIEADVSDLRRGRRQTG